MAWARWRCALRVTPHRDDIPTAGLKRLLGDIIAGWGARGDDLGLLRVDDTGTVLGDAEHDDPHIVAGTLAALAGRLSPDSAPVGGSAPG